jgi:hypothetical protein
MPPDLPYGWKGLAIHLLFHGRLQGDGLLHQRWYLQKERTVMDLQYAILPSIMNLTRAV